MRVPSDMPRPRRQGLGSRGRIGLVLLAVALFILLTSLRGIAGFYTDLLWFDSLGFRSVFTGVLGAKASLTILFSLIFFVLLWVNLLIGDRIAPRFRPAGPEEEVIERYHELIGHRTGLVRTAVSVVFALIAGAGVGGQWNAWILFTHAHDFGVKDAQFKTDVGFYVFKLPFLSFLVDWGFASIVIVLIVVAVAHYLNGGIRLQGAAQRVTPQVKAHLSVLLGLLAVIKAVGYWLQRYELTFSHRGTVDGATYTDVKAQLPAINLLILISVAAVALFIVNIWRRGWVLPVLAVGLWAFVALVVGGIYPAIIQRAKVQPAESSKEAPYIARNIEATRAAMNMTKSQVATKNFAADDKLDSASLAENVGTVKNIRLWDPDELKATYQRLQEVSPFYAITDVDVDRYQIDGETRQLLVSARSLNTSGVPQSSWEARHLTYTHGYGAVAAPSNAKDADGRPSLLLRDIPPRSTDAALALDQPGVYIGENLSGYVIVNSGRKEIDFQGAKGTRLTQYKGKDGVKVGNYLRRAAFALRFGDINPLISGNVKSGSKILLVRDVRERVKTLAPFLSFDADPYSVIVDGRVKWIVDAYTTTNHYPNAQRADHASLPAGSGLDKDFNYVRNSVKAVVDAYDGTTTFYAVDTKDPILRAYRDAFPKLFTDGSKVPDALRAHFRYPEDMFRVQTNMWGRYHIDDPDDFYNQNDAWNVAQKPPTGTGIATATLTTNAAGQQVASREERIEPYYLLMRLPGETKESFLLLRPFVPVSGDDSRKELTAFMVAKSDGADYGKLETFVMPQGNRPDGPGIVAATMQQDPDVSQLQTLLGQQGSNLIFGNLILVPIDQSLLYVRPVYTEAESTKIPELKRVIVAFNGNVAVKDTLAEALAALFGAAPDTGEEAPSTPGTPTTPSTDDVATLLGKAVTAFADADTALKNGDLGTYQEKVKEGQAYVKQAQGLSDAKGSTTTTTTKPGSTTSTTQPPDA
ncbi:MAG: hypothetical protein JWN67_1790 [Actinomycetia bacterium]|nr:hypothetical protein [Actinomycetes bacterium]